MTPATSEELHTILGDIDPTVLEEIEQTGASADEVAEAYAVFEADRNGEARRPMTLRVSAVHAIIEDAFEDLDEREWNYPAAGAVS